MALNGNLTLDLTVAILATHNRLLLSTLKLPTLAHHNAQAVPILFLSHLTTSNLPIVVAPPTGWPCG